MKIIRVIQSALLLLGILAIALQHGSAAELHLRSQCFASGPVVTLGDVVEISGADARQAATLAAIELFPAPVFSEEKVVRVREIQDLLLLRGVNMAEHQLSGSSEVLIRPPAAHPQAAAVKPIPAPVVQRIKRRVYDAIVKYLSEQSTTPQDWAIDFDLPESKARLFENPMVAIQVAGGAAPWTGPQQFAVMASGPKGGRATIDATVRVVAPVVVALRPLTRGTVIRDGDVALQRVPTADKLPGTMHALEEALNHELVRAVSMNAPVTTDTLRPPLAVHRGDVVTVLARAGGVRIRTNAKSREEGSVGELVAVDSLLNRSTYYARVTGYREVEVYARPMQAENGPKD